MTTSVALCTFNGARYLEQQLDSIRSQTLAPAELVICDDGSTDDTESIVERFRNTAPFPVRFYRNAITLGSTRNFEQAIRLCEGDAIALCDQDDLWMPQKLQRMTSILEQQPQVGGVFSNASMIDANGIPITGDLWHRNDFRTRQRWTRERRLAFQLVGRDAVTGATLVFRSRFVDQLLPISPEWVHDGWIALILAAISELRPVPECLVKYRLHASQQIGARQVAWHAHLSTQRELAIEFHRRNAERFAAIEERLATLTIDPHLVQYVHAKAAFLLQRADLLARPRTSRAFGVTRLLPGYFRFDKGALSYLRDVLH